jgi:hypothetical protein
LYQDQAGLTTENTPDIHTRARTRLLTEWQEKWNGQRDGPLLLFDSTEGFGRGMDGFHGKRNGLFGGDVRLASNHTGTQAHLQRINVVQDALCQCAMGYDTIDHGLWECGLHCTLRKAPGCWDRSRQVNKGYKAHF